MREQITNINTKIMRALSFCLFFSFIVLGLNSQPITVVYDSGGTYNWVCPAGVTFIDIELWGAGGGGAGSVNTNNNAGGGGGGAYAKRNKIPVTPGESYQIIVGNGGSAGGGASNGVKGGDSKATFGSIVIIAGGGNGGTTGGSGAGGKGGSASGGHINYSGGNGAAGLNGSYGGGGGGGAGSTGQGQNATNGTGGAATSLYGGSGGNGGATGGAGENFGGGGGGGYGKNKPGGAGAHGRVAIFYSLPQITQNPSNQNICINSSADFKIVATGTGTLTYQWKYQGENVTNGVPAGAIYSGANTPVLTISGNISTGNYSGYYCVVSNEYGFVISTLADLIVGTNLSPNPPYNLSVYPAIACSGTERTLSAESSTGVIQWYSSTCSGIMVADNIYPTQTSVYFAKVYDSSTGCYSSCSELTVNVYDNIEIISQPQSTYSCAGVPVIFSVIGAGSGITYKWQVNQGSGFSDITNGGVYSGAQSSNLTISDPSGMDSYLFRCVISGTCNSVISNEATLYVLSSGLSGTKTVGTGGDYPTLKSAFDAINANGLSGDLYLSVISDINETSESILNQWVDCSGNSGYKVTIYPSGGVRTISGNFGDYLVTLNGADYVTIDGRIDLTGNPNSLIFTNTNVNGTPLRLINDACYNTIKYATFRGALFGIFVGGASNTGNDFNVIEYCDIRESLPTLYIGILASGTEGKENNDNIIRNCNIYNFYDASYICRGIQIQSGNTRWKIIGNSLFQTTNRTDAAFWGIAIINTSGGEFIIEGNYIGGQEPQCGGNKMTYSSSSYGITFEGIIMQVSSTGVSVVKNNVIRNISFTSLPVTSYSQLAIFTPIDIYGGRVDVIENTIGDESTGSINVTVNVY